MTADEIMKEIHTQKFYLKAKDPSLHPKRFRVYLGTVEIETIQNEYTRMIATEFFGRDKWTIMGMPLFEVMTEEPHVKVTSY